MSFAFITLKAASSTVFVKVRAMRTQEKLAEVPSFILREFNFMFTTRLQDGMVMVAFVLSTCCLLVSRSLCYLPILVDKYHACGILTWALTF